MSDGVEMTCTLSLLPQGYEDLFHSQALMLPRRWPRGWLRPDYNASTNIADYEGKRVLILGRGNAAFEFANSI